MKKLFFLFVVSLFQMETQAQHYQLLIGTYTKGGTSKGIYNYDFDSHTGSAQLKDVIESTNPSYLAVYDRNWLYTVNEDGDFSAVSAFKINRSEAGTTKLSLLNGKGKDPCYILADQKNIIVANYSSGSIAVYSRSEKDGSIIGLKQLVQHNGKSIDPKRQTSAHVHQVLLSPDGKYIISNDLGEDRTYIYRYDPNSEHEVLTLKTTVNATPGSGPRHLAFAPNGTFAYLKHELNGVVTAFAYRDGELNKIQEVSTAPKDFTGKIDGADIHVSADGQFLYETNRGDLNTIAVFKIAATGLLTPIETVGTLGKGPRNFTIDPSGNFLLVAHQNSNEVVIFHRNPQTGKLSDSGKRIKVGAPVCLVFNK